MTIKRLSHWIPAFAGMTAVFRGYLQGRTALFAGGLPFPVREQALARVASQNVSIGSNPSSYSRLSGGRTWSAALGGPSPNALRASTTQL